MQANNRGQALEAQFLTSALEILKAREEENFLIVDICFHPRNKIFRTKYEAVCALHQYIQNQEQNRYSKEEFIINRCLGQSVGNESDRRQIEVFLKNVYKLNETTKQKLLELELPLESRETLVSLAEAETDMPNFLKNSTVSVGSALSQLIQGSRQRHRAQVENIAYLKASLNSIHNTSKNQSPEKYNGQPGQQSGQLSQFPTRTVTLPVKKFEYRMEDTIFSKYPLLKTGEKKEAQPQTQRNHSKINCTIGDENKVATGFQTAETGLKKEGRASVSNQFLHDNITKLPSFFAHRFSTDEITLSEAHSRKRSESSLADLTKLDSAPQAGDYSIQKARSPKLLTENTSPRVQKQQGVTFPNIGATLSSKKSLNPENAVLAPKNLTNISSLLHIDLKPLLTTPKVEIRKNFMEKMYQELLEANSGVQKTRNNYYQKYREDEKAKKIPVPHSGAESKIKGAKRSARNLINAVHFQQKSAQVSPKNEKGVSKNRNNCSLPHNGSKSYRTIKLLVSEKSNPNYKLPLPKRLKNASEDLTTSRVKKLSVQIKVMHLTLERNHERSISMANIETSLQRRAPLSPSTKLLKSPGFEKYYFPKAIGNQGNADQVADTSSTVGLQPRSAVLHAEEVSDSVIQKHFQAIKFGALERKSLQNRVLGLNQSVGKKKLFKYSLSGVFTDNLGTLP